METEGQLGRCLPTLPGLRECWLLVRTGMSQAGQELGALKTKDEAGPEPQRWLPYEMSVLGQEAAGRMHGGFMVEGLPA